MENIQNEKKMKELKEKYKFQINQHEEIQHLLQNADQVITGIGVGLAENLKTIEEIIGEVELERYSGDKQKESWNGKALIISVDCEKNNSKDVMAGGPEYLGYDFVVKEEDVEEMRHKIAVLIKKQNQPLIRTYVKYNENIKAEHIWSLKEIETCVINGYK